MRRSSAFYTERIDHLMDNEEIMNKKLFMYYGDLADGTNLSRLLEKIKPDEIYNLGAQSHVRVSFDIPVYTGDITGMGTTRLLEAVRETQIKTKFYQASSSELYGLAQEVPQKETTPFYPRSPYGAAKLYAYWMAVNYRESYNMFACNGILFNHESPRRGGTFVTKKITRALANIAAKKQDKLFLGNLDAKRDWGYAKDYVEAMWRILQHEKPDDFVIATNETHTVREFVEETAKHLGFDLEWQGKGVDEKGVDKKTGQTIIKIDPKYFRPSEVDLLIGDYSKAKKELGWSPETTFKDLVKLMVDSDLKKEQTLVEK